MEVPVYAILSAVGEFASHPLVASAFAIVLWIVLHRMFLAKFECPLLYNAGDMAAGLAVLYALAEGTFGPTLFGDLLYWLALLVFLVGLASVAAHSWVDSQLTAYRIWPQGYPRMLRFVVKAVGASRHCEQIGISRNPAPAKS